MSSASTQRPAWIDEVSNVYQRQILERLWAPLAERDQLYYVGYTANPSPTVEAEFSVLGSMRQGQRETYRIHLYPLAHPGPSSFWCSCPDHKFNSHKRGTLCKHISFLVTKVAARQMTVSANLFDTRRLTAPQFQDLLATAASLADARVPPAASSASLEETRAADFAKAHRVFCADATCPICFDALETPAHCLSCPTCHQYVHTTCMNVWLERQHTCVMCRSDVWVRYPHARRRA